MNNISFDSKLLTYLQARFSQSKNIERVVLFGSRARGDHTDRSDYDIAVFGAIDKEDKDRLRYDLEWETPTLHKIDLIFYEDCQDKTFKESILREGIVIYDQESK